VIKLLTPEDFDESMVLSLLSKNRPDIEKVLSSEKGKKWLKRTCLEIRVNLRRFQ
jgi:hypothetical protein